MYTSKEKIRKALSVFKDRGGILRTSEALSAGIHPRTLYKLSDEGYITKLDRGLYKLTDDPPLSNPDISIVSNFETRSAKRLRLKHSSQDLNRKI